MHIDGRRSLAAVVSWDATLSAGIVVVILLSRFDGFDLLFLALHSTHVFSVLLGCIVMNNAALISSTLRILAYTYATAIVFDIIVVMARLAIIIGHDDGAAPLLHEWVRLAFAAALFFVDCNGMFFADLSANSVSALLVCTDEQVQMVARERHAREVARLKRTGDNGSPMKASLHTVV